MNESDRKAIDSIKVLGLDMIDNANSGHPGIVLGAAPIMYALYANHMNINQANPNWINRDRFILSAGHGSALLYSTLFLAGYDIDIEELKRFRRLDSKTPGHPELGVTNGVDFTTGPLGQGIASAVGFAIAEKFLETKFNSKDEKIIDYNTYVLCSDGDLMEGVTTEAASLAGTLKLGKLIVLYDSNNICLDGATTKVFTEDVLMKYKAMGWHTEFVKRGDDARAINKAIANAKKVTDKPSIIQIKTVIGRGSMYEGTSTVHGKPLDKVDLDKLRIKLNSREIPFAVSKESAETLRNQINMRSDKKIKQYETTINKTSNEKKALLEKLINNDMTLDLREIYQEVFVSEQGRLTSAKVLNTIANSTDFFIGGSADLSSSTKTFLNMHKEFSHLDYSGRNLNFGVREHAMGAIINGLAASNLRPFASTFLVFSDYMKPSIRLAAIMKLPVIYIFTHDSISIGEDGPTHEPIEQLAMLRSIPNLDVYRPADGKEILGAYQEALNKKDGPTAIIISRSELRIQDETGIDLSKGAYIVKREKKELKGIIIATGKEVDTALMAAYNLEVKGYDLRVISMPNIKAFFNQTPKYINDLLPKDVKIIVIEAASSFGWHRITPTKYIIAIDTFGKSGTEEEVYTNFKFDLKSISDKIEKLLD